MPVDQHGRVVGLDDVFAAGDITTFPVKQGGIMTQQAFVAAEAIAALASSRLCRDPSHPCYVGCCLREATAVSATQHVGADESDWVSETRSGGHRRRSSAADSRGFSRRSRARVT